MKYKTVKKHKRARSSSNSSVYSISDDDSPQKKTQKVVKHNEDKHSHKKHRKHHRYHSSESLSDSDANTEHRRPEKSNKHKYDDVVRVKEEPLSDTERRSKPSSEHPRGVNERRTDNRDRRDHPRQKYEQSDSRGARSKPPFKEEPQSETEPEWGKKEIKTEKKEPQKNNAKPDFGLSGKLTEDANTFNGVVIKYSEPPEARKPKRRWRLYPFKGETSLPVLHIHRQSAYLMGRDRKVADIPIDHPSCSKQHAALQYRLVPFTRGDGSKGRQIKLYVIDLESANGTFLNNKKIEPKKYYELKERDVVKFGFSSREYVLLHEHSKDSDNDDDVRNDD